MELTQERLKSLISYDPQSGVFSWKNPRPGPGLKKDYRYATINIDGRRYLKHRLAWLYVHGSFPDQDIDHINCDPTDNSIANLRAASRSQNLANQKIHKNNSTGFKGVIPSRGRFRARVGYSGKQVHAGVFDTAEEAHAAYVAKAQELFGEFARAA